ncbi:MAG: hypothetical protein JJT88_11710 [Gammaproteobacteria bacterium]|nr:hypothetical protein [Gammaproteobacteria bacterium]
MTGAGSGAFERYVGIDYSGARSATDGLPGLRVYVACADAEPREIQPAAGKYFSRRGVHDWLLDALADPLPTLIGVDHSFSFPLAYFEQHELALDWDQFLDDFERHWPTADAGVTVESVRRGQCGDGAARGGSARSRRLCEKAAGAKSVFHFDVPGSVAKSTHAGLPWLRRLRRQLGPRLHVWPFDGWDIASGQSAILEAYPALYSARYPREDRTGDQHDAYSVAAWLAQADACGELEAALGPALPPDVAEIAAVEGWILGVTSASS